MTTTRVEQDSLGPINVPADKLRSYRRLIHFHEVDKGGHFAAWEQPEAFTAEIRAAFRSLR
jgi:pimeloyl-ACP methyl ester carboxylesterase